MGQPAVARNKNHSAINPGDLCQANLGCVLPQQTGLQGKQGEPEAQLTALPRRIRRAVLARMLDSHASTASKHSYACGRLLVEAASTCALPRTSADDRLAAEADTRRREEGGCDDTRIERRDDGDDKRASDDLCDGVVGVRVESSILKVPTARRVRDRVG